MTDFDIPTLCVHGVEQEKDCYWCKLEIAFDKFTKHSLSGNRYKIECTKGLWAVDAPTKKEAVREAKHYFSSYFSGGEYNE